jgi:hypothetical protein
MNDPRFAKINGCRVVSLSHIKSMTSNTLRILIVPASFTPTGAGNEEHVRFTSSENLKLLLGLITNEGLKVLDHHGE